MKTGTIVQLKSGGAKMTVRDLPLPGVAASFESPILCEWHSTTGQPYTVTYDAEQLKVVEEAAPSRQVRRAAKRKAK